LAAHVPIAVNATINKRRANKRMDGGNRTDRPNHIKMASNVPAVPGPHGQKPLPKPVPKMMAKNGGRFILSCKINRKNINIQRVFFKFAI